MILEKLIQFHNPTVSSSPVILPKTNNFIDIQGDRQLTIKERFEKIEYVESLGIRLLKNILAIVDIPYLKTLKNDFDRYTYYFSNVVGELSSVFHANATMVTAGNLFINKRSFSTDEFIIPTKCANYINQLPLGKPWLSWDTINPLKLIDYDSREYTNNIENGAVLFYHDQPTYAIIGIDVIELGFKYFKYIEEFGEDANITYFLYHHVWGKIFVDIQNIWLKNLYVDITNMGDINDVPEIGKHDKTYGYVSVSQYEAAVKEVYSLYKKVIDLKVKPYIFLQSIPMLAHDIIGLHSLSTHINYIMDEVSTSINRQFIWQTCLKEKSYIELLCNLYLTNREVSGSSSFSRKLNTYLNKYINAKIWRNAPSDSIKLLVQEELLYLKI